MMNILEIILMREVSISSKICYRYKFKANVNYYFTVYKNALYKKDKQNYESKLQIAQLNLKNYILYSELTCLQYKKAIRIYQSDDFPDVTLTELAKVPRGTLSRITDSTRIILKFMSHLILSNEGNQDIIKQPHSGILTLKNKNLENEINEFFGNYKILTSEFNYLMHRHEMKKYLEYFLLKLHLDEPNQITNYEKKHKILFHFFHSFLRPELYFLEEDLPT